MEKEKEEERYDAAVSWCIKTIESSDDILFKTCAFHEGINYASERFGYPFESISSLLRNFHLRHLKKSRVRFDKQKHLKILNFYIEKKESIISISKKFNYPPYMMARLIIENMCTFNKSQIVKCMNDPLTIIGDIDSIPFSKPDYRKSEEFDGKGISRLSREVMEVVEEDPIYGPRHDKERRFVGFEHEIMLQQVLKAMGIPFENEFNLRMKGTAKTPDVFLSIPLAVRINDKNDAKEETWKVICWIDSKALFGDERMHNLDIVPQAQGFIHRFGPGLILYWYGHAPLDRLNNSYGDLVITGWNVPDEFMLPTGDIVTHGSINHLNKVDSLHEI